MPIFTEGGTPPNTGAWQLMKLYDFGTGAGKTIKGRADMDTEFFYKLTWQSALTAPWGGNQVQDTNASNQEWQRYRVFADGSQFSCHVFSPGWVSLTARLLDDQNGTLGTPNVGGLYSGGIESGMLQVATGRPRFGYFESKIRMPRYHGQSPTFWLDAEDSGWPPEIDVARVIWPTTTWDTTTSFHFLAGGPPGTDADGGGPASPGDLCGATENYHPGGDFGGTWHIFGVFWEPFTSSVAGNPTNSRVTWFVDGIQIHQKLFNWAHDPAAAHVMDPTCGADVRLTHAVGGTGGTTQATNPVNLGDFPASMDVAWMRIWQRPADGLSTFTSGAGDAPPDPIEGVKYEPSIEFGSSPRQIRRALRAKQMRSVIFPPPAIVGNPTPVTFRRRIIIY